MTVGCIYINDMPLHLDFPSPNNTPPPFRPTLCSSPTKAESPNFGHHTSLSATYPAHPVLNIAPLSARAPPTAVNSTSQPIHLLSSSPGKHQ
ncbi:hypothetical protein Pmani_023129 [Petrolisthes manimaculis]|uniref:Uncharacterized protein n=1 Tax=Petrolisthes manimaculis TaxID=1843537 RepID=A0AAE1PA97_9EUCA|nr:hypothetical protein Pmani_023129 [Petrolisthes manimaculis]